MLWFGRQIGPLIRIVAVVVEFLAAIGITNVPPAVGADGVIAAAECCQGRVGSRCGRIGEQRADVVACDP